MNFIEKIKERAKNDKKRIVLPESMDDRIIEASKIIIKENLADIIIIGDVEVIIFIAFVFVIFDNRFNLAIIKIDKAEEDIDLYLQKKHELLERTRPVVNKALKTKDFMTTIDEQKEDSTNFENHLLLKRCYNELFKVIDENEKLLKT